MAVEWREVDEQTFWREIDHTWRNDVVDGITHYYLPAVPEVWKPGDVVRDAAGYVWQRARPSGWWRPGYEKGVPDIVPVRPLTRLVPEPNND